MSSFHFCLSAAKNLSSFQLPSVESIGSSTDSPAFPFHRPIENSKVLEQAGC